MDRLTFVKCPLRHPTKYSSRATFQEVVARLAAYEDTGLEPGEVSSKDALLEFYMKKFSPVQAVDLFAAGVDHLLDLAKAENEGRLVVLKKEDA